MHIDRKDFKGVITVIGVVLLFGSWGLAGNQAWLSDVILQIGSTLLLLVPIIWLNEKLATAIETNTAVVEQAQIEINTAKQELDETQQRLARSNEEISQLVIDRLASDNAMTRAKFQALASSSSRADLIEALQTAYDRGIVSGLGVRVPLDHLSYYALFRLGPGENLEVEVQTVDLNKVVSVLWEPGVGPVDFWYKVGRELQKCAGWNQSAYHPLSTFDHLARTLDVGFRAIERGYRDTMTPIFEIVSGVEGDDDTDKSGDWIVTNNALVPVERGSYVISFSRLHESDWDSHMRSKVWVDISAFRQAFDVATKLIEKGLVRGRINRAR